MQVSGATVAKIAVAAAAVGVVWYVSKSAASAVDKAGELLQNAAHAVSPFNNENIFYTAVNDAGASLTGDQNFSLGGSIYDWTHPEPKGNTELIVQAAGRLNVFDPTNWIRAGSAALDTVSGWFGGFDQNYTGTGGKF